MRAIGFAWVLLLLLSVACTESVDSDEVRTGGVYPEIEVTADGSGDSIVRVFLKVGGSSSNTYLALRGDDTLEVSAGNSTKEMRKSGDGYTATLPVDDEGAEFTIAFLRGDEDESAPASKVALPAPFALSLKDREYSRDADDVSFSWTPPGEDSIGYHLSGGCLDSTDQETPDTGTGALRAGSIETFESDRDESCTANLELKRESKGRLDPAFEKGGTIVARQVREKSFTSKP